MTIIDTPCDNEPDKGWATEYVDHQLGETWDETALLAAAEDLAVRIDRFRHEFGNAITYFGERDLQMAQWTARRMTER